MRARCLISVSVSTFFVFYSVRLISVVPFSLLLVVLIFRWSLFYQVFRFSCICEGFFFVSYLFLIFQRTLFYVFGFAFTFTTSNTSLALFPFFPSFAVSLVTPLGL